MVICIHFANYSSWARLPVVLVWTIRNWASLIAQLVKKYICNAGDPGSIPISGLGRFVGKGIGYPIQYSWAFLAQFPNTFEDFKAEK